MPCGQSLNRSFRQSVEGWGDPVTPTVPWWRRSCGGTGLGRRGGTCRRNLDLGQACTRDLRPGPSAACGKGSWSSCARKPTWSGSCRMAPSFALINIQQAKGGLWNQALGRSRGGCSTKIHLICDAHGNPLDFLVTPGQAHESRSAEGLLCGWQAEYVFGDRAYDGNPVRKAIEAMGATAVIPPHPRRKNPAAWDSHLYKARHAIEHGFAKLKQFRALATRFDKTARSFSAQVALACIVIWLRL
ncbi:hypothetical protein METESE_37140 [Mesoterricola sediminis]|uniref:Transposase IS4-like domain-containing protein n=1 Tax=Mesoterricola sediminis TaxID=2927980 RepID=A0AA48KE05_9BACT|nr:hypothetical protein METESE_37140 [Mesoterricola sediminis]